jgi:7,8-dihydropterin-6-yl-methyl-4-(beta-D-ribofuranosyl)aminobenzene 5'-phosphate synthase
MKTFVIIVLTIWCCQLNAQLATPGKLLNTEKVALFKAIENDAVFATWVKDTTTAIKLYENYKIFTLKSDSAWDSDQQRLQKTGQFGYTNKFELIPLVERQNGNVKFKNAEGVSYLIRTDNATILFDTGIDEDSIRSVFRYNLDKLGVDISEIDIVFISHNHEDHQNNWRWINDKTFVNAQNQNTLPKKLVYVPEDNLNLSIATRYSPDPVKICDGVYTTGTIRAPLFFYPTQEQSLIFNVKDKGLIIVTGCGHQKMEKLLQRCDKISDVPVYGILGGIHFPVDGDFEKYYGYFITGKLPWEPFTMADVDNQVKLMQNRKIKLIGISAHDSSGKAIGSFQKAFAKEYKDLRTGELISMAGNPSVSRVQTNALDSLFMGKNLKFLDGTIPTYYSASCSERAKSEHLLLQELAKIYADNGENVFRLKLAVLDSTDWTGKALPFPYGFFFNYKGWVVIPGDYDYHKFMRMFGYYPYRDEINKELKRVSGNYESLLTESLYKYVIVHELGHFYTKNVLKAYTPDPWTSEIMASYFAIGYLQKTDHKAVQVVDISTSIFSKEYVPKYRSLLDFNTNYANVGLENYCWYHAMFQPMIDEIYAKYKTGFLEIYAKRFPLTPDAKKPSQEKLLKILDALTNGISTKWMKIMEGKS